MSKRDYTVRKSLTGIARCEHLLGPVTALAFAGGFLFAGEGPYLRAFPISRTTGSVDEADRILEERKNSGWRIFDAQAIHGIEVAHDGHDLVTLIIYGGCYIRAIGIDKQTFDPEATRCGQIEKCSDWILDLAIRPQATQSNYQSLEAVAITAHNALIGLSLSVWSGSKCTQGDNGTITQTLLTGATKCMLYAASVRWLTPRSALVVSGTAFGELIIWTCGIGALSVLGIDQLQVHYAFSAHDGSVFGLDTHFSGYQSDGQPSRALIASCSDDRTIRVWDVSAALPSAASSNVDKGLLAVDYSQAHELVSGHTSRMTQALIKPPPECFAKLWAHSSRIWYVKFADFSGSCADMSDVTVFSFGEDATTQAWNLSIVDDSNMTGLPRFHNVGIFSGHSGKNVWSNAIFEQSPGSFLVATGGADGCLVIGRINNPVSPLSHMAAESWSMDDILSSLDSSSARLDASCPPPTLTPQRDGFKTYCFVDPNSLVTTTQKGKVVRISFPSNTNTGRPNIHTSSAARKSQSDGPVGADVEHFGGTTEIISERPILASYSLILAEPALGVAFLGVANGQILLYDDQRRTLVDWNKLDSKIAGLFLSPNSTSIDGIYFLLATEMGKTTATLLAFAKPSEPDMDESHDCSILHTVKLDLPTGFIVTSMVCSNTRLCTVLLGSRDGRIIHYPLLDFFKRDSHHNDAATASPEVLSTYDLVGQHQDAVTSLQIHYPPSGDRCHVLSTARDSTYAIHDLSMISSVFLAERLHTLALPFGPNIEGATFCASSKTLSFYGFHSKDFVEYSETDLTEITRIECGGAHRVWAHQPMTTQARHGGRFTWTKASRLHSIAYDEPDCALVKTGGHGREIKACAQRPKKGNGSNLLATGAEDTDIRLFKYASDNAKSLRCVTVIRKHNTGIQQLQWSPDGRYLFSCGGCEELFVWRIRDDAGQGGFVEVQVVCEATLPLASELPDLRIMSISVQEVQGSGDDEYNDKDSKANLSIFMVFSDSTMRTYSYKPSSQSFRLSSTGVYKTCCLTQAHYLTNLSPIAITGATDGTLCLWNTQDENETITLLHSTRVHKNAIKDIVLVEPEPLAGSMVSEHLIFSVGDDNALAVTRMSVSNKDPREVLTESLIIPRAHVAAATALAVISTSHTDGRLVVRIATSGNDQRLKSWEFACDLAMPGVDGIDAKRLSNDAIAVADVSCMADFDTSENRKSLVICGVGMQVFSFE